jgi:hypothetical protein
MLHGLVTVRRRLKLCPATSSHAWMKKLVADALGGTMEQESARSGSRRRVVPSTQIDLAASSSYFVGA